MKLIYILAGLFGAIWASGVFAAQHTEMTRSDTSIKEFQRRVLLIDSKNGYESMKVDAEVEYCPLKPKTCYSQGTWTFNLSKKLIASDDANLVQSVGLNRFDQMTLTNSSVGITTPYGKVELNSPGSIPAGGVADYADFRSSFEKVLAERSPAIATTLAEAVDLRAKSLRDKEVGTAMTGKMKSAGLDFSTLKNMMDDGFAFANFVEKIGAKVTVSEFEGTNPKTGEKEINYSVKVAAPVSTKMLAYHFEPNSHIFNFYKEWKGESGPAVSEIVNFRDIPSGPSDVKDVFYSSYSTAFKAAMLNLSLQVKRDDNFNLATKVTEVEGGSFKSNLHAGLDVRADSLWNISRSVDGESKQLGLGKTRHVAAAPKEGEEAYSGFANIKGNVEQGDQLSEFPWMGEQGYLSIGIIKFGVSEIGGDATGVFTNSGAKAQSLLALQFGEANDLGYMRNSDALSEVWLTTDLTLGLGGSTYTLVNKAGNTLNLNYPMYAALGAGLGKAFYLGSSGIAITPSTGLGLDYISVTGKDATNNYDYSFEAYELTFKPGLAVEYTLDKFSNVRANFEYPVQILNMSTLKNSTTGIKSESINSNYGQGPSLFLSYRWNFDEIGSSAKLMK